MPDSNSASPGFDERRSGKVFTVILLLVLLAVAFPEMSPQGLQGILWTGSGLLMILWPPVVRVPRLWVCLGAGFVVFSLVGFLPREWFHVSSWRSDLEALGLDTGARAFVQPRLAAEVVAGFAATTLVALFLLGHRVDSRFHQRLALGFTLGVGAWATAALQMHQPGSLFGFFPNRNHTATLLVMGTFTGLGCLAHAIRRKDPWKIPLSAIPVMVCLYALHAVSESRAGVILVIAGFLLWIILTGFRQLQGSVGKALVLIVIAASGTFLLVDSTAKKRLAASVDQLAVPGPVSGVTPENPFSVGEVTRPTPPTDGRIAIFQDTLEMIRHESWTGVGPGQFAQAFSQYRNRINASNDARCLHPESDWLLMLAEAGWPSTVGLAAGVVAVFFAAVRQARQGRSRFLRMGCIVGALLLCLHGVFDVPGHRVGLAWAAVLLLASALRSEAMSGSDSAHRPTRLSSQCWRALGLVLALGGIFLIHAQWTQRNVLPSVQVRQCMIEARKLYDQDQAAYDLAKAEGRDYQPPPSEDPLEIALLRVKQAIDETPLDPYLHYVRGSLALHYDDKRAIADQSFAIQRRLDPTRVNLAMEQARAWSVQDPRQVIALWKEALQRASSEQSRHPGSSFGVANTYQTALHAAGKDDSLVSATLELAGGNASLLGIWARSAPVNLLDREMPRLLSSASGEAVRKSLFQIWEKRGSKDRAADFAKSHPELNLAPP
ncbi:MAG: O-antigen ligase family protein [Verrucomicrobiota bacterium]